MMFLDEQNLDFISVRISLDRNGGVTDNVLPKKINYCQAMNVTYALHEYKIIQKTFGQKERGHKCPKIGPHGSRMVPMH